MDTKIDVSLLPELSQEDQFGGSTTVVIDGQLDGTAMATSTRLDAGEYRIGAGTTITWPAGAEAPFAESVQRLDGRSWSRPFGDKDLSGGHPVYYAVAALIANAFGIMGMPHIVVRFYTNPTGRV